jgi:hypothetical protein
LALGTGRNRGSDCGNYLTFGFGQRPIGKVKKMVVDTWDRLKGLGYKVWWNRIESSKDGLIVPFTRNAMAFDLEPYLPIEQVYRALSVGKEQSFYGFYLTDLSEKLGIEDHYYFYRFHGSSSIKEGQKEFPVYLMVEISGRLSGPFPEGTPIDKKIYSEIIVGDYKNPVPVEQDKKYLCLSTVKKAVRAVESFVAEFPDANVSVLVESRKGRGGWRRKIFDWQLGLAQYLAQEENESWE